MNTTARLSIFIVGLVLVFGISFAAGRSLVPDETVSNWTRQAQESSPGHEPMSDMSETSQHQEGVER